MFSHSQRLDADRKILLQLDGNNSLLNYRPYKAKGVESTITDPVVLLTHLLELKPLEFIGLKKTDLFSKEPELRKEEIHRGHYYVPCNYDAKSLSNRLLKTYKEANGYIEEKGVNILFISIGTLTWQESDIADKPWASPLLLIPVEIERTGRFDEYENEIFEVRYNEEEIEDNFSLIEALKDRHNILFPSMPDWAELEKEEDKEHEIRESYDQWIVAIKACIHNKKSWKIEEEKLTLSFFSFTKYFMYKDLDPVRWFTATNREGPGIIQKLFGAGFVSDTSKYSEHTILDYTVNADSPVAVLDMDSSQAKVILDVQRGIDLVVEGPPGTGKSQTIANLLADAVTQGKKVLFVSEKQVALEVVKRNLEKAQLGHLCLELHGSKAKKSEFVKILKETLDFGRNARVPDGFNLGELIANVRELRNWSDAVNTPLNHNYSPFELIGLLLKVKGRLHGITLPNKTQLDHQQLDNFQDYLIALTKDHVGTDNRPGKEPGLILVLQRLINEVGKPKENPFWGCELITAPLSSEIQEISDTIGELRSAVKQLNIFLTQCCQTLQYSPTISISYADIFHTAISLYADIPDEVLYLKVRHSWSKDEAILNTFINHLSKLKEQQAFLIEIVLREDFLAVDYLQVRGTLMSIKDNWWNRLFNAKFKAARRSIRGILKSSEIEKEHSLLEIADRIILYQGDLKKLSDYDTIALQYFDSLWNGPSSDEQLMKHCLDWGVKCNALVSAGLIDETIFKLCSIPIKNSDAKNLKSEIAIKLGALNKCLGSVAKLLTLKSSVKDQWKYWELSQLDNHLTIVSNSLPELGKWVQFNIHSNVLKNSGKSVMVDIATTWDKAGEKLVDYYLLLVWEKMLKDCYEAKPVLSEQSRHSLENTCKRFQELDRLLKEYHKATIINEHNNAVQNLGASGEAGYLKLNIQRKRRIPSVRDFMKKSFNAITTAKPIIMMSPLSVASYLDSIPDMFDMVVFDEASQIEPVDAYGAMMRAKQVVVVGDTKQMPPTNFFKSIMSENDDVDDENDADNDGNLAQTVNSIMEVMLAKSVQKKMLHWHYRSRHESLIQVSNNAFYENKLLIYPSISKPSGMLGLHMVKADFAQQPYEKQGINNGEAESIAKAVAQFSMEHPEKSLGVVAFNIKQSDLIDKKIQELSVHNEGLQAYIGKQSTEPFFVKNLERVQGDERDVMFISIGYGKTKEGIFGHQFGPLNKPGGEKRLNVLITRAKLSNYIFCNFSSNDIDLTKSNKAGVKALKSFLKYAELGMLDEISPTGGEADSEFEVHVASELQLLGYDVVHQVGTAGYRIDLGIKHPVEKGLFIAGLECDGATYHSSRSARDRDRLRQSVLEGLGWTIFRIWSTDWYSNKDNVLRKIHTEIQQLILNADVKKKTGQVTNESNIEKQEVIIDYHQPKSKNVFKPYICVDTSGWRRFLSIWEIPESVLERYILQIVHTEAPIHVEQVCKSITEFQKTVLGSRVKSHIEYLIRHLAKQKSIDLRNNFVWKVGATIKEARDYSSYSRKDIEYISDEELELAFLVITEESISIGKDELISEVANRLGFKNTSFIKSHLSNMLAHLLKNKRLVEIEGSIKMYT